MKAKDLTKELEWLQKAAKDSGDKIKDCPVLLTLFNDELKNDPLACLQLGIAVMLDKPIAIVAIDGVKIPENLRKIAKITSEGPRGTMKNLLENTLKVMEPFLDSKKKDRKS